jgi:hypothetical protein
MIKAAESALAPPGIAEAAAKIGIHFDGSWFNTVAGGASGVWHDWATDHAGDFPGWPGVDLNILLRDAGGRKPHTLFPIPARDPESHERKGDWTWLVPSLQSSASIPAPKVTG